MSGYRIPVWNVDEDETTVHAGAKAPKDGAAEAHGETAPATAAPAPEDAHAAPAPKPVVAQADSAPAPAETPASQPPAKAETRSLLMQAAAQQVLWAKLFPRSIEPGQIGEFAAKLRHPLKHTVKFDFVLGTGEEVSQLFRPDDEVVAISAITFSKDLRTVYVYIEPRGDAAQQITAIELDGKDVIQRTRLASRSLAPGQKSLAVVSLPAPLEPVAYVCVKVATSLGVAQERVRVFHGFPIHTEGAAGGMWSGGMGLDPQAFACRPYAEADDEDCPMIAPPAQARGAYLLYCLNHIFDRDWARSARLALKRCNVCAAARPDLIPYIHLCRNDPMSAFPRFAELLDALEVNPAYTADYAQRSLPWQGTARTLELAIRAAAPKPVFAVLSNEKFDMHTELASPEEFRQRAYAVLSLAPKAILYRWKNPKDAEAALRALAAEARDFDLCVASMRDHFAVADAFPNAAKVTTENTPVEASCLVAGDKAVVLILISRPPSGKEAPSQSPPPNTVKVSVSLHGVPTGSAFGQVLRLTPQGPQPVKGAVVGNGALELPFPALAEAFLLPLVPAQGGGK